jgi:hypothetical protein
MDGQSLVSPCIRSPVHSFESGYISPAIPQLFTKTTGGISRVVVLNLQIAPLNERTLPR